MIKNQVGLEAEFFLRDADGELVLPGDFGFGTDDYIILGECRAMPGVTREETLANFMERWYGVVFRAHKNKLTLDIETGWTKLSVEEHAAIMREMGTKEVSIAQNINGTDILELTDAIIHRGKIVGYRASIGLHVHFSSSEVSEVRLERDYSYVPVSLPITIGDAGTATLDLYRRLEGDAKKDVWAKAHASRITKPVVEHIVRKMDGRVLGFYKVDEPLKFRNPGFYEMKSHGGFEYRSLPFNQAVLDGIATIVDSAYILLEEL